MFRSILVPLDGSELAEQALPLALSIARRAGAELTLLQVVPLPSEPLAIDGAVLSVDEQLDMLQENARVYLRDIVRNLPSVHTTGPDGLTIRRDVSVGPVAQAITDYATGIQADLIVMATHGRSGFTRWALGSVTDQVLQMARVPMIVVRPQTIAPVSFDPLPTLDRIMITLDGSELAAAVLPTATQLARLFDSQLLLFRAALLPAVSYVNPEMLSIQASLWESAERDARTYLKGVAASLKNQGFKVQCLVGTEGVAESIVTVAAETDTDLIAMTTHGRSGLSRVVYGSVTDRVVRSASRPVLVVRSSGS